MVAVEEQTVYYSHLLNEFTFPPLSLLSFLQTFQTCQMGSRSSVTLRRVWRQLHRNGGGQHNCLCLEFQVSWYESGYI